MKSETALKKQWSSAKNPQVKKPDLLQLTSDIPIDLENDALLEEFKVLKAEIQDRLRYGQQITNLSIAFLVAVIGFLQLVQSGGLVQTASIRYILTHSYLIAAALSSCFALMYIGEDITIGHLGTYINQKLRPKVELIIQKQSGKNHSIWEWDDFRNQQQFRMPMLLLGALVNSSKYILTIAPAIALFIAYLSSRIPSVPFSLFELCLITVVILVGISIVVLLAYEAYVYLGISKIRNE